MSRKHDARNSKIFRLWLSGTKQCDIATMYNMSNSNVYVIINHIHRRLFHPIFDLRLTYGDATDIKSTRNPKYIGIWQKALDNFDTINNL